MRAAALILAVLMVAMPVADTGTGAATGYDYEVIQTEGQTFGDTAETEVDLFDEVQFMTTPTEELRQTEMSVSPEEIGDNLTPTETEPLPSDLAERGYLQYVSTREIEMLAWLVDNEIGGGTRIEKEAIVWEVLNRIDSTQYDFRNIHTVTAALTQRNQYWQSYGVGSIESQNIVVDILTLWMVEKQLGYPVEGRVLPREYRWHSGDYVAHNYFRDAYQAPYTIWDWRWTGGY